MVCELYKATAQKQNKINLRKIPFIYNQRGQCTSSHQDVTTQLFKDNSDSVPFVFNCALLGSRNKHLLS